MALVRSPEYQMKQEHSSYLTLALNRQRSYFLYNYFKIHPMVKEDKVFKGFSIFSSCGHFVQQSGKV